MRWSEEQLAEFQERTRQRLPESVSTLQRIQNEDYVADPGPESDLQGKIENWCEEKAFPYFHDHSRGKNESGFTDLVIAFPRGVTGWFECKSKTGRLSKDQRRWRLMLLALGHKWHEVRSFKQFLSIAVGYL